MPAMSSSPDPDGCLWMVDLAGFGPQQGIARMERWDHEIYLKNCHP